jgi:hypothetical protein
MPDPERRKKMISLRLSDAEYEALKSKYSAHGARNVSDLARLALHHLMQDRPIPTQDFALRLADLEDRISMLERQVSRLANGATDVVSAGRNSMEESGVA